MIIETTVAHRDSLLAVVEKSDQFGADGLAHVAEKLDAHFANPDQALWYTAMEDDSPVGVAYCVPEPVTSGTWNLLMLWMKDGYEGKGSGQALVRAVETALVARKARLLIVETCQTEEFEPARTFYVEAGFVLEAEVKNFFDWGENKLIYAKSVAES